MSSMEFDPLLCEEEDVIIEGSELHQALTNVGLSNFDLTPKAKMELYHNELTLPADYKSWRKSLKNKVNFFNHFLYQENSLKKKQLQLILDANIMLDDHAATISEFICDENVSKLSKLIEWLPFIGSTAFLAAAAIKQSIPCSAGGLALFGTSLLTKFSNWITMRKMKNLLTLQREVHELIKYSLKILRRHCKKSLISESHEKNELIGREKYEIILEMQRLLFEIFENLSKMFYLEGNNILNILPSLQSKCSLTKIELQNNDNQDEKDYQKLKNLYYTYILAQSEVMFILANAYNGHVENVYFNIPHRELSKIIFKFNCMLSIYYSQLSRVKQAYNIFEIKPVTRVFRGTPTSKWQDTYIHLDLTSQRIQSAYKEIVNILELIDANSEQNEDDLVESITTKMNEAYKQIENARSFAEFSSLLIAKAQHKTKDSDKTNNDENLFPVNNDNRNIVMLDEEPEIEDEVFEEYIREEYLKPMYENSDGSIIDNYKLDKLLKKNFMSELKDALIDKQKSMTERELRALRRMYEKVRKESKTVLDKSIENIEPTVPASEAPPPPPPPPPPSTISNRIIAETHIEEAEEEPKKGRTPVPLPRVKMLQPDDEVCHFQQFSITDCTPKLKFPAFNTAEETFLGSGENSEEEENNNPDNNEDVDVDIEN